MSINIKLDENYYITDNSHNTAILAKKLGINKNGKHTERRRYFTDFGRAIVAWARETGKSGENVTSFQKAAEIFDKKIEEAKTAINESCSISYEKGKKDGKEEIIQKFEEKHHVRGASK
ncbi:hypothetical protein [Ligilactobacillus salivarius]|uniref:hypothetical protein n=1 Tax=Ligilactobacillus salivarius TaxID=1624 RepID=UPI000BAF0E70|nr:hypothetical protein [Ligilactobacillus salivarius]PAY53537.1 hypothetical protein A8C37_05100 [Ligilactobacillus salivarius]